MSGVLHPFPFILYKKKGREKGAVCGGWDGQAQAVLSVNGPDGWITGSRKVSSNLKRAGRKKGLVHESALFPGVVPRYKISPLTCSPAEHTCRRRSGRQVPLVPTCRKAGTISVHVRRDLTWEREASIHPLHRRYHWFRCRLNKKPPPEGRMDGWMDGWQAKPHGQPRSEADTSVRFVSTLPSYKLCKIGSSAAFLV